MARRAPHAFPGDFRRDLDNRFKEFLDHEAKRFPDEDCLRIDLHCHDENSDVPDELWGRLLRLPETWLPTSVLVEVLERNGSTALTITNHNNARSCWALQDAGRDVLVASEFTCHYAEYELFLHVLAFGFDRDQEPVLAEKRRDIFEFLRYCAAHDIPTILPHPLYFYTQNAHLGPELFEKLAVMFQRFEVLNGQRDLWQSVLTLEWVRSLTAEKVEAYAGKHRLDPSDFGVDPRRPKILTGGSDDHMGLFAGSSGSRLYVPDLQKRLLRERPSQLALEAIRDGRVSPFGHVAETQKLTISILDYLAQVATRMEDPGLLRMLLHRGDASDKLACIAIANLLLEIRHHGNTRRFFDLIHDALRGRRPNHLVRWRIAKNYRFAITHLDRIAATALGPTETFVDSVSDSLADLFREISDLVVRRLRAAAPADGAQTLVKLSSEEIIRKFEVPTQLTALVLGGSNRRSDMSDFDVRGALDDLSFPFFMGFVLMGATFGSARALHENRAFLNAFADRFEGTKHPRRALYLTDTLRDRNGVSSSLSGKLAEIQRHDLPIDFVICHATAAPEPHLHVVRPITTFTAEEFGEQEFRVPDILEIAQLFHSGGYDRVVCSTEGPMALVALFLKFMFNVPAFFFMHTDWLDFAKHNTELTVHERDRIRRVLRAFYKRFDGIFVLNDDHRDWLASREMEIEPERIHRTAHHAEPRVVGARPIGKRELFPDATEATPIFFTAGRLSREKGIFDLPEILARARESLPDIRLVVAGDGPAAADLRAVLPDARFVGWVDRNRLAELYLGLDLFVFPSRFDTFGNVLVEALTHGMPVVAYGSKGPKDILEEGRSGYLVESTAEMADRIVTHFREPWRHAAMRAGAERRAAAYQPEPILRRFLEDLGLDVSALVPPLRAGDAVAERWSLTKERSVA